jgi:antitoxin PrlF
VNRFPSVRNTQRLRIFDAIIFCPKPDLGKAECGLLRSPVGATLSSKSQVTIPKSVREYLNLKPGDRFKFFLQPDGAVVILPKSRTARLKGSVPKLDRVISIEEMNTAIEAGATERFRR